MKNYAIVIGIDGYVNPTWGLDGAVQDALDFAHWTLNQGAVPPQNLKLLLSPLRGRAPNLPAGVPAQNVGQATSQAIRQTVIDFKNGAGRNGQRLYFYFAGHGVSAPGAEQAWLHEPVLVPSDITDINVDSNLFLGFTWILTNLASARPREQVFFFDACRDLALKSYSVPVGTAVGAAIPSRQTPSTQYVLYATSLGQKAKEKGAGIFSKALLQGLGGAWDAVDFSSDTVPPSYEVRFDKLSDYLARKVTTRVQGQRPRSQKDPGAPDLVLASFKPKDMPPVELDVYVRPGPALATCEIQVLYPLPDLTYYTVKTCQPPALYPTKLQIPPNHYHIQAQAARYQSITQPWSIDMPPHLKLSLKKIPRASATEGGGGGAGAGPQANGGAGVIPPTIPSWAVGGEEPTVGGEELEGAPSVAAELALGGSQEGVLGGSLEGPQAAMLRPDAFAVAAPTRIRVPTGGLQATSNDPEALIVVWGPGRRLAGLGTGGVQLDRLPIGSYRVALSLPEGGPAKEQTVEVKAGKSANVRLNSPPPLLGHSQMQALNQLDIYTDSQGYLHPSEYLGGITNARLASLLGFAAFAAYWPGAGDFYRLKGFGVTPMSDLSPGASGVTVLLGASVDKPAPDLDKERLLSTGEVVMNPSDPVAVTGQFSRLSGFPAAAQFSARLRSGASTVELRLPGLAPTRYPVVSLPDRVTVLIVAAQGGGQFDVQQYMLPLPNRNRMVDEFLLENPTNIRRIELAQRYYANGHEIPNDNEIDILLGGKLQDPLLGCLAGYSLVRSGKPERYAGVALQNMLKYFDALPDSHILAGLCEPDGKKRHFADALERGIPIFSEGFRALCEWAAEDKRSLPPILNEALSGLLPASPWTAWTVARSRAEEDNL